MTGPYRLDLTRLNCSQQLCLQRKGHIANLIEKQRTVIRRLYQPGFTVSRRAGKCPLYVTKQLAFQQLFRDSRTVDGNKRLCLSVAQLMNGAGDNLFSGPAFASNHHAGRTARYAANQFFQLTHRATFANQLLNLRLVLRRTEIRRGVRLMKSH